MNEIISAVLLSIALLGACMGSIITKLRILKCRPFFISPNQLRGLIGLLFAPVLILGILGVAETLASGLELTSLLQSSDVILMLAVIVFWIMLSIAASFRLFNITADILIESISKALNKQGLKFSVQKETQHFSSLIQRRKVTVVLDEIGSEIKIISMVRGSGWMRVKNKKLIPNYTALIADFKDNLAAYQCGLSIKHGFAGLFLALVIGLRAAYAIAQYFV